MPKNPPVPLTFYPAYCFSLSPTYDTWARLTVAEVHALTEREGFEGTIPQYSLILVFHRTLSISWIPCVWLDLTLSTAGQNTYFHLNHPIKWIRLVGVVVAFDEFPQRWIMLLDDGSGAVIEVTCGRPPSQHNTTSPSDYNIPIAGVAKPTIPLEGVTSTGRPIDLNGIDVGTVVKVKGKIGSFRGERQMHLERICMLRQAPPSSNPASHVPIEVNASRSLTYILVFSHYPHHERRSRCLG